jgi:uncharacterized membrane protein YhaH (DUF805 family)
MLTPYMNLSTLLFSFQGRIGRLQWWLFILLASLPCPILDTAWDRADDYSLPVRLLLTFVSIVPVWCLLAVGAKRLHDCDISAWWLLLLALPLVGAFALFVIHGFIAGTPGPNRFGQSYAQAEPQADRP